MARLIPEDDLPEQLGSLQAVEAAYPDEFARTTAALMRGLPVLIECDKGLVGWFYAALRNRLRNRVRR